MTVALYVRIGVALQRRHVALQRRHVARRFKRRVAGQNRRQKGNSTVAMMCRVGNDLCTAATAAVVLDPLDLDDAEMDQSATTPVSPSRSVAGKYNTTQYIIYNQLPLERHSRTRSEALTTAVLCSTK